MFLKLIAGVRFCFQCIHWAISLNWMDLVGEAYSYNLISGLIRA